jgi:hypothetical protein
MSLKDTILDGLKNISLSIRRMFQLPEPHYNVLLVEELTRYFLSAAIDDRVQFLADAAAPSKEKPEVRQKQEEEFRLSVRQEYNKRVEDAIRADLKSGSAAWPLVATVSKNLSNITIPGELSAELLSSPAKLVKFFQAEGIFFRGSLPRLGVIYLLGTFLIALQRVTLEIINTDYPAADTGTEVPASTTDVLGTILRELDKCAQKILIPVKLKSLKQADIELRVLAARSNGGAALPLKPIPTAPLGDDSWTTNYVGRADEEAQKLALQIRHADGTILVTGYRGVGKSSFVNRALFHALAQQNDIPGDGWMIVPVRVNLAKVAGVPHVLRLTLRAVREALVHPDERKPNRIPGNDSSSLKDISLPLDLTKEIEPLEEAYIRATYKVSMSRADASEKKWEAGSSFSIDPGKLVGGSILGIELGKFLEGGIRKTRTEKINRELSLLDYDENAAEDDLGRLIRELARPRALYRGGPEVRIKLVFVFDELDKMDIDQGLRPMIEGLKNLFLQRNSVFILVTSKKFYYDLLKDRAIEDAMLNSYFSAIVHVPLLSFAEAQKMVEDWVDWNSTEYLKNRSEAELKLMEQVTRVLLYRSFGNPRDIIRELRKMQEWSYHSNQPFLTDRVRKTPALQIFAAVQECIEKTAVRQQSTGATGVQNNGNVALASERLEGDEARLEQVRRGLYILVEELINRQTLLLEPRPKTADAGDHKPATTANNSAAENLEEILEKIAKPSPPTTEVLPLAKIQSDNFSLLSMEDVQGLAKHLGNYLRTVHNASDLFSSQEWGVRRPLFEMPSADVLRVTSDFYDLTGRKAVSATVDSADAEAQKKEPSELIKEAEYRASQTGWPAKLSATRIIKQLDSVPKQLESFVLETATKDSDPNHRQAAVECFGDLLFRKKDLDVSEIIGKETDQGVLGAYVLVLGAAADDDSRKLATEALLMLLKRDTEASGSLLLPADSIQAWSFLRSISHVDATDQLLAWLKVARKSDGLEPTVIEVLTSFASKYNTDVAEKIFADDALLSLFAGTSWTYVGGSLPTETRLKAYFREMLRPKPLEYGRRLFATALFTNFDDLLAYLWDLAYASEPQNLVQWVFGEWLSISNATTSFSQSFKKQRLTSSLRMTVEFQTRLLPYLRSRLNDLIELKQYSDEQVKTLQDFLKELEGTATPSLSSLLQTPLDLKIPGSLSAIVRDLTRKKTDAEVSRLFNYDRPSKPQKPIQGFGLLVLAMISFLLGLTFFKWNLPVGATIAKTILSRLLLLALDAVILSPVLASLIRTQNAFSSLSESRFTSFDTPSLKEVLIKNDTVAYGLACLVAYGLYEVHTRFVGPLSIGAQTLQFLINLPTIVLALMAWERLVDSEIYLTR